MTSITFPPFQGSVSQQSGGVSAPPNGARYLLLDSVRDAAFLNKSSTDGLGNTIPDMGLGVVDNGIFVYTSKFTPGSPTVARPYPLKFFWIGSPAGTNDTNDNFSIFMADVNESAYFPGASASTWLVNPRLVLSTLQAGNDIINWFDSNYPYTTTPPSGGVGQETPNGQSNGTYGKLSSGGNPGNVSRMGTLAAGSSIDGQFWPVYDYVDNSILLYFSIKTPNVNTKAIYCYKATNTEISSPLGTSQFLGGVYATSFEQTLSSHRFSIISPDPLVTNARVSGQQSAVLFFSGGTFDNVNPDHGRYLTAGVLSDIHTAPLNWQGNITLSNVNNAGGVDAGGQYNPDKLGSIFAIPQGNTNSACYACLYNATSDRDLRSSINPTVVINAMQIRIAYFHPAANTIAFGSDPISFATGVGTIGHCRPQFTTHPDGLPKIIYNDFAFDQSLKTVVEYIDPQTIRPERQNKLYITADDFANPFFISTFGKKKMHVRMYSVANGPGFNPPTPYPQNDPAFAIVVQLAEYDGSYDHATGAYYINANDTGSLILGTQQTNYNFNGGTALTNYGFKVLEFSAEDLPAFLGITMKTETGNITPEGVVILE